MPLSYQPLYLVSAPTPPDIFRRNQEDFSKEYFQRIRTTQSASGRVESTWNRVELDRPRALILPETISGLYNGADKHYDLFCKRQKHKKQPRPLGLNNHDRYKAALDNGPWGLIHQRTQNTRREAARKLIEVELKKRQQQSVYGTVILSGIIQDEENDAFYARDLLHAPQIVATKASHDSEVGFRLPSMTDPNVKKESIIHESKSHSARKDIHEQLDPTREPQLVRLKLKYPIVSTPVSPPFALGRVPEEDTFDDDSSEDDDNFLRSSSAGKTLESQSSDNLKSILKPPQSLDRKDNKKTVSFLDNDYLERVRLYYMNSSNPSESKVQESESTQNASSIPIMPVIRLDPLTHGSETENSDWSTSWKSLAELFKSTTGDKRKRTIKRKKKKKAADAKSSQPDESPRPESVSDRSTCTPDQSEQTDQEQETNDINESNDDTKWKPTRNRGDGFVYKLQPNGSFVEYKVPDDEISGHITDAELSYRIREIHSRPVLKPSPPPLTPSPPPPKSPEDQKTSLPLKRLDTALRRKSLRPTSAPFLAPELHPPKNDPRVSACVNWTAGTHNRKTVPPKDTVIRDDDLEVCPLLLNMRHCRYIRWTKNDEFVVERLHDLEDQLAQKSAAEIQAMIDRSNKILRS